MTVAFELDAVGAKAADQARAAAEVVGGSGAVGELVASIPEGERVVTHQFESLLPGYKGWRWAVVVSRVPRARHATVDEVVLIPGPDALVPAPWVPWSQRLQPGDLRPGDVLPTAADDPRLVGGWADIELDTLEEPLSDLGFDLGLTRARVLSYAGRDEIAQQWYDGDSGPEAAVARAAADNCVSCGFLLPMAGSLGRMFGVCANIYAADSARVVSFDHGCGAHSEVVVELTSPVPVEEPIVDDEFEPIGRAELTADDAVEAEVVDEVVIDTVEIVDSEAIAVVDGEPELVEVIDEVAFVESNGDVEIIEIDTVEPEVVEIVILDGEVIDVEVLAEDSSEE